MVPDKNLFSFELYSGGFSCFRSWLGMKIVSKLNLRRPCISSPTHRTRHKAQPLTNDEATKNYFLTSNLKKLQNSNETIRMSFITTKRITAEGRAHGAHTQNALASCTFALCRFTPFANYASRLRRHACNVLSAYGSLYGCCSSQLRNQTPTVHPAICMLHILNGNIT